MGITMHELTSRTGLEINGVNGRDFLDRSVADGCLDALERYGVVIYRDANISDADLVAFSRMLGEVVIAPLGNLEDHPEISAVTRDASKSALAAYREGTFYWHLDGATDDVPEKATLLTAREVSYDGGGDTEFANTYAAYDALPDDEKAAIANVRVVHSLAAAQLLAHPDAPPEERATWNRRKPKTHPLVWTRANGRKSLLLGATAGEVVGMDQAEGRALLDRLLAWVTQPQFVIRHQWRKGDLAVWDNTGMLHRALPYTKDSRRLMHRTTLVGVEGVA
jgi:alpha-ketoglutarate-dependent taurine dioxygenase